MTSIIVCMTMLGRAAAVPQHRSPSLTPFAAARRMCAGLLGARQLLSMTFSVCMELRQNPAMCPNVQTRQMCLSSNRDPIKPLQKVPSLLPPSELA